MYAYAITRPSFVLKITLSRETFSYVLPGCLSFKFTRTTYVWVIFGKEKKITRRDMIKITYAKYFHINRKNINAIGTVLPLITSLKMIYDGIVSCLSYATWAIAALISVPSFITLCNILLFIGLPENSVLLLSRKFT